MTAGFWLRVNNKWMPLEGVQAGVGISTDRPSSDFTSLGGRRYVSRAKRGPREWSLDLSHATPEAVRLLALAAQGQAGDAMLLDLSAARANMLDPLVCVGPAPYGLVDCDGIPLRSLTPFGVTTETVAIPLSENNWIESAAPSNSAVGISLRSTPAIESLVKIALPADPAGRVFASASLELNQASGPSSGVTITAYAASNAWNSAVAWATAPAAGGSVGSGSLASGHYSIPLSGVTAFRGTDMSLRLKASSSTTSTISPRSESGPFRPELRITYSITASDRDFLMWLRGGIEYRISAFTNAAEGVSVLTYTDVARRPVLAPSGTGDRLAVATFTPAVDTETNISVLGSTAGRVSGLRLTEGAPLGPWVPGQKAICRVSIPNPEQTLNYLLNGEQGRSDYRVTLREVG